VTLPHKMLNDLRHYLIDCGLEYNTALLTMPLTGDADVSTLPFELENILNMDCDKISQNTVKLKFIC